MNFLGKDISGCFTIPSGIITTQVATIGKVAETIPEIGVLTTKSIGLKPRPGNREPILAQYAPGCFMNAVGLANPGADEFARRLQSLELPPDRFLLISIFGKDADEFVKVAQILEPYADGFELNLSCPHASGLGMAIGQDPSMVNTIVRAVKHGIAKPVIAKLTPNVADIAKIARAAVDGGADGLCAINTVGPGYYTVDGVPVLTNVKGGMSGSGILPIGLDCVKRIADTVAVPIIGCGGIRGAADVRAYKDAGASVFGIGSSLAGLSTEGLAAYFRTLSMDLDHGTDNAVKLVQSPPAMEYAKFDLSDNVSLAPDLHLLVFQGRLEVAPGQFVFIWIPGIGEKPFSVLDEHPLTFAIRKAGLFTSQLTQLVPGDSAYIRGPYGCPVQVPRGKKTVLVSGGCGIAALYAIAREAEDAVVFVGARDKAHLFYLEQLSQYAEVHVATDDGSEGFHGVVTELVRQYLQSQSRKASFVFYNCGPEPMIAEAVRIQRQYADPDAIFNSVDYITQCGVGICGSCASPDGRRLCVDGPFLSLKASR